MFEEQDMAAKRGAETKKTKSGEKGGGKDEPPDIKSRRLSYIIENLSEVVIECDSEGTFTYISPQLEEKFGYKPDELIGKSAFEQVHPDDLEKSLDTMAAALEGNKIFDYEFRTLHKDGHYVPVVSSGRIVEEGSEIVMVGIVKDISQRKAVEDALEEKSELLDAIFNNTTEGIFVLDEDFRYVYINPASGKIVGHDPEKWVGKKAGDHRHPEDARKSAEAIMRALNGEEARVQLRVKGSDGKYRDLDIQYSVMMLGDNVHFLGVVNDVTDSKRLVEELKTSESRYRALAESAHDYIYLIDRDLTLAYVNEAGARLFKSSPSKMIGKDLKEVFPKETYNAQKKSIEEVLETGEEVYVERPYPVIGRQIWLSARLAPVHDGEGNVARVLGISRDITERKSAETALKESEVRYSAVVNNSKDSIIILKGGEIVFINPAVTELTGYSMKELASKNFSDFISPKFRKLVNSRYKDRLSGKDVPSIYEIEIMDKSGLPVPIEINSTVIEYEGSEATLVIIRDLTERRMMEEKWRAIAENAPEMVMLLDLDGKITYMNRTVPDMKMEDVIGKSQYDYIQPEYHDAVRRTIEEVIRTGKPGKYSIQGVGPKGQISWYESQVGPLKVGERVDGVIIFISDITNRKLSEDALKESEMKYRNLFEYSPESTYIIGLDGTIIDCNSAVSKVTGVVKNDLIGTSLFDLGTIFEEDVQKLRSLLRHLAKGEELEPQELRVKSANGSPMWVEVFLTLLRKENGDIYAIQAISRDITDRKTNELEMRKQLLKFELEEGNAYLVKESDSLQSLEIFKELLSVGYAGMVMSRKQRKAFEKYLNLNFDHYWISEKKSESSIRPDPRKMEKLIESRETGQTFLLDCFDYLASKVGFEKTLEFMQSLKELAYIKNHIFIIQVDPATLKENELRLLERETNDLISHEALGKLDEKLLEVLRYVDKENKAGLNPSYSEVGTALELSKPTARKRIRTLIKNGCLNEISKGRNKLVRITNKGETYMVLK